MTSTDSWDGICLPDRVDSADPLYSELSETPPHAHLGDKMDLIEQCPRVHTQHVDYSCSAQAVVSAIEFLQKKHNNGRYQDWSRLFVYYNARLIERGGGDDRRRGRRRGRQADLGASIKSAISAVKEFGVCPEPFFPYRTVDVFDPPGQDCYDEAENHQVTAARLTNDLQEMKSCLSCGYPFAFRFRYGDDYPDTPPDDPGFVNVPLEKKGTHAVMAVGYDDARRRIVFQNSKGEGWGVGGYGYLSYDYITNGELCSNFWTIRGMEDVDVHPHPRKYR